MTTKETPAQIKISPVASRVGIGLAPVQRKLCSTWWLAPRPFDLVSSLLYIGVLIPYLYSFVTRTGDQAPLPLWQAVLMTVAVAALLAVDRVEYYLYGEEPPRKAAIFLLLTRIAFIEVLSWLDAFKYSPFLYLVVLFLACLYFGEITGYGLAVVAWIVYFVKHTYYNPGWLSDGTELHYLVLFTIGIALVITVARVVVKEKASRLRTEELLAVLEVSHQQLKDSAEQAEELATTRERNRLARDIHDSLGHYLAIINVQLEKALAFRERNPREAEQAVRDSKRLANEALQDVRRSVSALRAMQETFAFTPAVTSIVERVRSSQLSIELSIEGSEEGYSRQALMALYRAVQEGLTNIQKHSGANSAQVEFQFGDAFTTLRLADNGCGFEPEILAILQPGREGNYGLQGVRERLELVGGSLHLESRPGAGTCLLVTIPKDLLLPNADKKKE